MTTTRHRVVVNGVRRRVSRNDQFLRVANTQGLRPVAAGLATGLVVSLATARFIDALLFGVAPVDPVVLGGAALAVLGLAGGACLVPAVRALRSAPAQTLHAE